MTSTSCGSTCQRCGREQPAPASPCPACSAGYHILTTEGERPILIVDGRGSKVFSFTADLEYLAMEILHNLNTPVSQWAA